MSLSEADPYPGTRTLRVVSIGGGTGLSTLLRGLKRYVAHPHPVAEEEDAPRQNDAPCHIRDLTAIVTVTDDGGSSGRLREDFKMLPPGDVRNCLVALSEDDHLLSRLFRYRFEQGELEGHSFGNLFMAALSHITGDFAQAVQMSSQILATRGRIFPATNTNVTLTAEMDDGTLVRGETNITASRRSIVELRMEPASALPLPEALDAIAAADLITIGPGSLYTSLITNLLVQGVAEALATSKATRVYVCNLMTQANESLNLTASEHIEKICRHACLPEVAGVEGDQGPAAAQRLFDYAIVNTGAISPERLAQYAAEGQCPIEADLERIRELGITPVTGDFVYEGEVLRHNYEAITEKLLQIGFRERRRVQRG